MTEKLEKEIQEVLINYFGDLTPEDLVEVSDKICNVIDKNSSINQVEEFMTTFNQKVRVKPEMPTPKECLFRLELCKEELVEIAEACGSEVLSQFGLNLYKSSEEIRYKVERERETLKPNLIALLDAFIDSLYVMNGFIITAGMQNTVDVAFEEVHSSNMSKACISAEEAQITIEKYKKEGIEVYGDNSKNPKLFLIHRSSDNKVLKSINYKPADLYKFVSDGLQDIDE